jgi:hypothetical protein
VGDPVGGSSKIAPDGAIKKRLCYEALGNISRAEAGEILRRKVAQSGSSEGPTRSRVTFRTLAQQWQIDVLPTKYKHSTRKNHQHIMEKHLIPRFGDSLSRALRLKRSSRTLRIWRRPSTRRNRSITSMTC